MKAIVIEYLKKFQKKNSKQNNVLFIWFTTHKHPGKQKMGEDNELFVYPPSNNKKTKRGELIVEV